MDVCLIDRIKNPGVFRTRPPPGVMDTVPRTSPSSGHISSPFWAETTHHRWTSLQEGVSCCGRTRPRLCATGASLRTAQANMETRVHRIHTHRGHWNEPQWGDKIYICIFIYFILCDDAFIKPQQSPKPPEVCWTGQVILTFIKLYHREVRNTTDNCVDSAQFFSSIFK